MLFCNDIFFRYCSLLSPFLSYYPACSTFVYTCPCPLEGIINSLCACVRGVRISAGEDPGGIKKFLISKVVKKREIGRTHH